MKKSPTLTERWASDRLKPTIINLDEYLDKKYGRSKKKSWQQVKQEAQKRQG